MNILEKVYLQMLEQAYSDMGTACYYDQWQWEEGVMFYGFIKAYEKTGDEKIYDFIKHWTDYHMERMDFGLSINTTAPLLGVMKLLEKETHNEKYLSICRKFADWCLAQAPRADLGCFEHSCTANKYPNQIWADTLFMGCLFLVKWGLFTGNDTYMYEAIRQFELHYKFLKDDETSLIYHGYDCNDRKQKGVLWGRGNCWLAVSAIEILNIVNPEFPGYATLKQIYLEHINAVINFQNKNGGWHTVIDKEDTYIEMSATAAFGYSVLRAINTGFLEKSYIECAEKALEILKSDIDSDGKVLHGSNGTCVMENYIYYNDIPYAYTYFTQGLAMMFLSEAE